MSTEVNSISCYAVACNYSKQEQLKDGNIKLNDVQAANKAIEVFNQIIENQDLEQIPKVLASLENIRSHLSNKVNSIFYLLFINTDSMKAQISQIDTLVDKIQTLAKEKGLNVNTEEYFHLKFLGSLPKYLRVTQAPSETNLFEFSWKDGAKDSSNVNEWKVLRLLSQKVYESNEVQGLPESQRWEKYNKIMLGIYQGDHILIEDDEQHTVSNELCRFGAIIRGSSHDEKGRKILDWNDKGEPVYDNDMHKSLLGAEQHHYGLTGQHIKHILFYPTDRVEKDDGTLIMGKTARQVFAKETAQAKERGESAVKSVKIDAGIANVKKFVALQFESSPDCEGNDLRSWLFYKHRLAGFVTYRSRKLWQKLCQKLPVLNKIYHIENANVGPYGFGRSDDNSLVLRSVRKKA